MQPHEIAHIILLAKAGKTPEQIAAAISKQGIPCDHCGKEFHPRAKTQRFCSRRCKEGHRKSCPMVEVPCAGCGVPVMVPAKRLETCGSIMCSKTCPGMSAMIKAKLYRKKLLKPSEISKLFEMAGRRYDLDDIRVRPQKHVAFAGRPCYPLTLTGNTLENA